MVINFITSLLRVSIKSEFYHRFLYLFEILGVITSLGIYYFTSQALGVQLSGDFEKYQCSYFDYLIIAELFLTIPLYFFEGTYRKTKQALADGIWQSFSYLNVPLLKAYSTISLTGFAREVLRYVLTFILAKYFFSFQLHWKDFGMLTLYAICFIPVFFSIGLVASSILIKTGRGQAVIGYLNTGFNILAGSFFPLSILPHIFQSISHYSPYTLLLENIRLYFASHDSTHLYNGLISIGFISLISIPVSIFFFFMITKKLKADFYLRV